MREAPGKRWLAVLAIPLFIGAPIVACNAILGVGDPVDVESDAGDEIRPSTQRDAPSSEDLDAAMPIREGGHCSAVEGGCDIVLQDCPAKQECALDNSGETVCQPVQGAQQLPLGRRCCPSSSTNPCQPGLTCVGSNCTDAGPPTARCSPACCKGDDQACGKSDPEGISGACDLTLTDPTSNKELYQVCTYRQRCEPFRVEPCKAGETCLVEDQVGTASCVTSGGKGNRAPCSFGNECADGLICLGAAGTSVCHYACLLPNAANPFDASVEQGGPGSGGCAAGELCNLQIQDLPTWYGACSVDGG
jgi:hypothetical protein